MRLIKPVLIGLTGLFLMMSVISLLMPADVRLVRTVLIHAPKEKIQLYLMDFSHWPEWQPMLRNPKMEFSVRADGSEAQWKSGNSSYSLVKNEDTALQFSCKLNKNGKSFMDYYFNFSEYSNMPGIQLQCKVVQHTRWYPWDRFAGLLFEQSAGPGVEAALQELRSACEK